MRSGAAVPEEGVRPGAVGRSLQAATNAVRRTSGTTLIARGVRGSFGIGDHYAGARC
jgi:hypothetical protein